MASFLYAGASALAKRLDPASQEKFDAIWSTLTQDERKTLRESCTVDTCPIDTSYYFYRVSLPANATFLAFFALSFIGFMAVAVSTWKRSKKSDWAFTFALASGTFLEIMGYVGRIMSWDNQWKEDGFLMQIVCLTIAPAFMAGGIYLCLRRIVGAFGAENSRLKPEMYTRIFIPCDVASLLLQAAGGGVASAKSHAEEDPTLGNNIMIAGLAFQVATLTAFIVLSLDFAIRTYRRQKAMGESAFDQNPVLVQLRKSTAFRGFVAALTLATICIFWRSVYRVAELAQGWTGDLIKRQNLFIAFEGVMVVVAVLALNAFHPAVCFQGKVADAESAAGHGIDNDADQIHLQNVRQKNATADGAAVSSNGSDTV